MLHSDSTRRFPAVPPKTYSAETFRFWSQDSELTIERNANSLEWAITVDGKTHTRTGPAGPEQVHLSWRAH